MVQVDGITCCRDGSSSEESAPPTRHQVRGVYLRNQVYAQPGRFQPRSSKLYGSQLGLTPGTNGLKRFMCLQTSERQVQCVSQRVPCYGGLATIVRGRTRWARGS